MSEYNFLLSASHSTYFYTDSGSIESLNNLTALIAGGFISEDEVKITKVPDIESAERLNFQGSPTILFDGYDIYTEIKPKSHSYNCRIYTIENERTGILTKEFIRTKIKKLRG